MYAKILPEKIITAILVVDVVQQRTLVLDACQVSVRGVGQKFFVNYNNTVDWQVQRNMELAKTHNACRFSFLEFEMKVGDAFYNLLSTTEGRREYQREKLYLDIQQTIYKRMEELGVSKYKLAQLMGKRKSWTKEVLDKGNMTLKTIADICTVLGIDLVLRYKKMEKVEKIEKVQGD